MNKNYTHEDGTPFTKEEFLEKLKIDKEFSNKFGRKSTQEGKMALPPCHWAFELYTEELTDGERNEHLVFTKDSYGLDGKLRSPITIDWGKTPKRRLSLKWHQRSVDFGLGLSFNIASYALLLHMFAQQTNMVPGQLVGDLTNIHIYNNHIEQLTYQSKRDPLKYLSPILKLNKVKDIFSYSYEDFEIVGYDSYPTIKMPIAV